MDFPVLQPGKLYKTDDAGNLVEVVDKLEAVTPVPEEDLPPDMRSSAIAAQAKIDTLTSNVQQLADTLRQTPKLTEPELVISEEEKIKFLKAAIANKPYKRTFSLFGGKVKATFKTLSTAELDAASEAIVIQGGRVPYSTMLALAGAHMRFCMVSSLCELQFESDEGITNKDCSDIATAYPSDAKKETFYVKDPAGGVQRKEATVYGTPGQKVLWAAADRFADISTVLYNILFEKYQRFDAEQQQLVKETADADFFPNGAAGPY